MKTETKTKSPALGRKAHVALFLAVFLVLNLAIGRFLEIPKNELIRTGKFDPKLRWEEFYSLTPNSVRLLFLGSSHAYRSFDPEPFDRASGRGPSFNMGSSAQTPITGYFVLREVLKTQRPQVLVFELYWNAFENREQFVNATYNFEYIRSPGVKADFLLRGYAPADWVYFLAPPLRYRHNIEDTLRLLAGKKLRDNGDRYAGSGYVENAGIADPKTLEKKNPFEGYRFEPSNLYGKQLAYLEKIARLCEEYGIRLVFVTAPLPETSCSQIENYRDIHNYFQKIADAWDVPYFDYNLIAEREGLFSPDDFKDADHLNRTGAAKITADFARRMKALRLPSGGRPAPSMAAAD